MRWTSLPDIGWRQGLNLTILVQIGGNLTSFTFQLLASSLQIEFICRGRG